MAAKIVHQMKEKMLLAGQGARLAEMIPKREGALTMPSIASLRPAEAPKTGRDTTAGDNLATSNLHLPLALRKQRRPNAGFKPQPRQEIKKKKRANTVMQLKEELRQQLERKREAAAAAAEVKAKPTPKQTPKKKLKRVHSDYVESYHKKKKIRPILRDGKTNNDAYCWVCHKEYVHHYCQACPRVYHRHCIPDYTCSTTTWFCPECQEITTAECIDTQSAGLACLSDEDLAGLLQCCLARMKHSMSGPFLFPVSMETAPNYLSYIFNPMDLTTLEKNIRNHLYGSPEAFLADVRWITHNCIIYNGTSSKLTRSAELITEIAEHEIQEIQICPDCYSWSSSKKKNWFCEPCRTVHTLVWAKLKGFPYWPAKVLREDGDRLDVRFFGQHDRAWVQVQDCYRISKEMPFPPTNNKTNGLNHAFREVEIHMKKLRDKRIRCEYSPIRTPYDPARIYANRKLGPSPVSIKPTPSKPASGKGRKRKRKGNVATVKKTFVPVLRDLEPLSYDSDEAVDPGTETAGRLVDSQALKVKKEAVESVQAAEEADKRVETSNESEEVKGRENARGDGDQRPSGDKGGTPVEASSLNSPDKDGESGTPKGDTPTNRFNVSRKVYSRSGKFISLASNITEDVRSVVDWVPSEEEVTETGEEEATTTLTKDDVKPQPDAEMGGKVDDGGEKTTSETSNSSKVATVSGSTSKVESADASVHCDVNSGDTPAVAGNLLDPSASKSVKTPVVLPNKLPDPQTIMVKPNTISTPLASSEGTQVTPQKNDKFNEKLNQTIKSCRKFLGLESSSTEREQDSDDETLAKSDLDSEAVSSQDDSESESVPSRQVTPLSMMEEGISPKSGRSSRKPSVDFSDSDSEENDNPELKLVIDGEMQKREAEKGKSERPGEPLASPKLFIKLPFGPKGKQRTATDAESSLAEDDDDFDGDKEMGEIVERAVEESVETEEEDKDPEAASSSDVKDTTYGPEICFKDEAKVVDASSGNITEETPGLDEKIKAHVINTKPTNSSDMKDTSREPQIGAEDKAKVIEAAGGEADEEADEGKDQEKEETSKNDQQELSSGEVLTKADVLDSEKKREKDEEKGDGTKPRTSSRDDSLGKDESEKLDGDSKDQNDRHREGDRTQIQERSRVDHREKGLPRSGGDVLTTKKTNDVAVGSRTKTSDGIVEMEADDASEHLHGEEETQRISTAEVNKKNSWDIEESVEPITEELKVMDDGKQLQTGSELDQIHQTKEVAQLAERGERQGCGQEMEAAPSDDRTDEGLSRNKTGDEVCRREANVREPESANVDQERIRPDEARRSEKANILAHVKEDDTSIVRRTLDHIVGMIARGGEECGWPSDVDMLGKSDMPNCSKDDGDRLVVKNTIEDIVEEVERTGRGYSQPSDVFRIGKSDEPECSEDSEDRSVVKRTLEDIVGEVERNDERCSLPNDVGRLRKGDVPEYSRSVDCRLVVKKTLEDIVGEVERDDKRSSQPSAVDMLGKSHVPECSKDGEDRLVVKRTLEDIMGEIERDDKRSSQPSDVGRLRLRKGDEPECSKGADDGSVVKKTLDDIMEGVEKFLTTAGGASTGGGDATVVRKTIDDIVGMVEKEVNDGDTADEGGEPMDTMTDMKDVIPQVDTMAHRKDVNDSDAADREGESMDTMSVGKEGIREVDTITDQKEEVHEVDTMDDRKDDMREAAEVLATLGLSTPVKVCPAGPEKMTGPVVSGVNEDGDDVTWREHGAIMSGTRVGSDVSVNVGHPGRVQFETIVLEEMDFSEGEPKTGDEASENEQGRRVKMGASGLMGKVATINGEEVTIIDDVDEMEVDQQPKEMDVSSIGGVRTISLPGDRPKIVQEDESVGVKDMDVTESLQPRTPNPPSHQDRVMKGEEREEEVICLDEGSPNEADDVDPVVRDVLLSICRKIAAAVSSVGTGIRADTSSELLPSGLPGASGSGGGKQPGEPPGSQVTVPGSEPGQWPTDSPTSPSLGPEKFGGWLLSSKEKRISELEEELRQMRKKWMIEKQEGVERKSTYELMVLEIFENYQIILEDKIAQMAKEHETELLDVKRKQWCAFCQKEAVFFCCWNTSYCDYPCQQKHWALHQRVCQQATKNAAANAAATPPQSSAPTSTNLTQQSGPSLPTSQPGPQGSSNLTNLIQYVRFMPGSNNDLHTLPMRSPTMVPIQMPSAPSTMGLGPTGNPQIQQINSTQITGAHMQPGQIPGQPLPGQQMQTAPSPQQLMAQQLRPISQGPPMGPAAQMGPYQQNLQAAPQQQFNFQAQTSVVRQRMPNGNEVLLHLPQGIRMPSMLTNPNV